MRSLVRLWTTSMRSNGSRWWSGSSANWSASRGLKSSHSKPALDRGKQVHVDVQLADRDLDGDLGNRNSADEHGVRGVLDRTKQLVDCRILVGEIVRNDNLTAQQPEPAFAARLVFDEIRNREIVLGDGHRLPVIHPVEQARKLCVGFGHVDGHATTLESVSGQSDQSDQFRSAWSSSRRPPQPAARVTRLTWPSVVRLHPVIPRHASVDRGGCGVPQ